MSKAEVKGKKSLAWLQSLVGWHLKNAVLQGCWVRYLAFAWLSFAAYRSYTCIL